MDSDETHVVGCAITNTLELGYHFLLRNLLYILLVIVVSDIINVGCVIIALVEVAEMA